VPPGRATHRSAGSYPAPDPRAASRVGSPGLQVCSGWATTGIHGPRCESDYGPRHASACRAALCTGPPGRAALNPHLAALRRGAVPPDRTAHRAAGPQPWRRHPTFSLLGDLGGPWPRKTLTLCLSMAPLASTAQTWPCTIPPPLTLLLGPAHRPLSLRRPPTLILGGVGKVTPERPQSPSPTV
jgi:hypothetical protein